MPSIQDHPVVSQETPTPGKKFSKVSQSTPSTSQPVETPTPGKKFSKVSQSTPSTSQPVETPTRENMFWKVLDFLRSFTSRPVDSGCKFQYSK
eukprot:XP_014788101.1 PREDICTED: uncharacterized protein LOC106882054 isoform X3 [Octopus bimaculoides]